MCLRSCSILTRTPQSVQGACRQRFSLPATASPPLDTASVSIFPRDLVPCLVEGSPPLCSPLLTQLSLRHDEQGSITSFLRGARTDPRLWDGGRKHPGRQGQSPRWQLAWHGTPGPVPNLLSRDPGWRPAPFCPHGVASWCKPLGQPGMCCFVAPSPPRLAPELGLPQ